MAEGVTKAVEPLEYHMFIPAQIKQRKMLVLVHGIRSSASSLVARFVPMAHASGTVLFAPYFSREKFRGYQRLRSSAGRDGAALALENAVLREAKRFELDTSNFNLFGFSAGAQFAHRFAMTRPQYVNRLIVGAAGWYGECDETLRFPQGMRGRAVADEVDRFLAIPTLVVVGEADTGRGKNLRQSEMLDQRQGPHRLARAQFWVDHISHMAAARNLASQVRLKILPGTAHSLRDAVKHGKLADIISRELVAAPTLEGGSDDAINYSEQSACYGGGVAA